MTDELSRQLAALRDSALDIESHVARFGWDGPIHVFALVKARAALDENPALAQELPADVQADSITNPDVLFSVEQEGLPQVDSLNELFGRIQWPESVDGAAVSVERIILPPSVEVDLPDDEAAAMRILQSHPQRQDVRIVVAVMRTGESWTVVRMRDHDAEDMRISSQNAVPGLIAGLADTFR